LETVVFVEPDCDVCTEKNKESSSRHFCS